MKTIEPVQRKKIFALVRDAHRASGTALPVDRWRHELQEDLGIESLSSCSAEKGLQLLNRLHRIIDGQRAKDFSPLHRPAGGRPKGILEWTGDQKAQLEKVEALLADMGLPWDYADSIAKRMFGASVLRVDSLDKRQLTAVISALMKRQKKYGGREYGPGTKEVSRG